MDEHLAAAIQRLLDEQPESARFTTAVVATLARGDAEVIVLARKGHRPRFTSDSRFLLYSVTKTIVAAALLKFVAAGQICLDDTLERWWPELCVAPKLTLRHVLGHTGGLPDYGALTAYHQALRERATPWDERAFLAHTNAETLLFEPGRSWAYSNIGYMLLRRVLTRVGAGDMETVLCREIFSPLGIETTSVPTTSGDLTAFAFGPSADLADAGNLVPVPGNYDPGWIAPGVVGATAADAARMLAGIMQSLLPPSLRSEMVRPVARFSAIPGRPWKRPAYGLGIMIDTEGECAPIYGHTGGGPGCTPAVFHSPACNPPLTVAVVTDGENQAALVETIALAVIEHRPRPTNDPGKA